MTNARDSITSPTIDVDDYVRFSNVHTRPKRHDSTEATVPASAHSAAEFINAVGAARTQAIRDVISSAGIGCTTMVIATSLGFLSISCAFFYAFGYVVASVLAIRTVQGIGAIGSRES